MTKVVRFTREMRPRYHIGDEKALPDELADELIADGGAEFVPSVFDKRRQAEGRSKPIVGPEPYSTRVMEPSRHHGKPRR